MLSESHCDQIRYAADRPKDLIEPSRGSRWHRKKTSAQMPLWASRLTLEIRAIRAERLHDIDRNAADAERPTEYIDTLYGRAYDLALNRWCRDSKTADPSARLATQKGAFPFVWDRHNRKHPWWSNPWVWVLEFALLTSP